MKCIPIDTAEVGIKISDSCLHSENAQSPIDVTENGIVIFLMIRTCQRSFLQLLLSIMVLQISLKTQSPIDLTDGGILISINDFHSIKFHHQLNRLEIENG